MFSWDTAKALRNREKHGVAFEEAATVFADPDALDWDNTQHSLREERFKRLGMSLAGRVLLVAYTVRRVKNAKENVRIISARQASRRERRAYAGQPH